MTDVELQAEDFKNILNWYERAFAKQNNPTQKERNTFIKLSAMAISKTEEMKSEVDDDE